MDKLEQGQPLDTGDQSVLAALREVYARTDPPPADLVERIGFDLTVRELEADVARLVEEPVLTRGGEEVSEARTISFSTDEMSVMVTVSLRSNKQVRIDGWLTWGEATVQLTDADGGGHRVRADQDGRFVFESVPAGPTRLLCEGQSTRPVMTPTFTI